MENMQLFRCPVCDGVETNQTVPYKAKSELFSGRLLSRCEKCSTWSIHPVPNTEELNTFYEKPYWNEERLEKRRDELWRKGRSQYLFIQRALIKRKKIKLLDIGAGLGPLHQVLSTELNGRIDYNAVEINPAAIEKLQEHGAEVYPTVQDAGEGFDGVIL